MRILVTGGAGYIGSHTARLLADAGHEPVVFDDLSQGHDWAVRWGPLEAGSLTDRARLDEVLRSARVEAVVHFAARALVGESMTNPAAYFETNVLGTFNLLEAMRAAGVATLVFSSTCATYGDPVRVPIDETHPQAPVNPYGESKLMVEKMLRWYGEAYGLRWMALRYFNAAGADPNGEIGEVHDPETHLIPLVIEGTLGRRPPVKVFGSDYPTPDGTAIRDYIHVVDLADAHLRALERLGAGTPSQALNLGTGRGHSVREVIETVRTVSRQDVPFEPAPRRAGDPPMLVADASRAREVLGWEPKYPELSTIVEHAWRWHTEGKAGR
ncbi:MAG TPA: UDP-glucose 4-epimerase GalE [Vicinamibacterales bacterium]